MKPLRRNYEPVILRSDGAVRPSGLSHLLMRAQAMTADSVRAGAALIAAAMQPGGKAALNVAIEHERATIRLYAVAGDRMPELMPEVEHRRAVMGGMVKALDSVADDVAAGRL